LPWARAASKGWLILAELPDETLSLPDLQLEGLEQHAWRRMIRRAVGERVEVVEPALTGVMVDRFE